MNVKTSIFFLFYLGFFSICSVAQSPELPEVKQVSFRKDTFHIIKYGAVPGGLVLNTHAINAAIDACNLNGGGVVVIPAGLWLSGPLVLKSNVNLHLEKNAVLDFTRDFDQYPLVKTIWEGVPQMRNQSPISAVNQTNIAITGSGIIDGSGDAWRMVKKFKMTDSQWKKLLASGGYLSEDKKIWYPTKSSLRGSELKNPGYISPEKDNAYYTEVKDFLRPNMVMLSGCKKILLEGVTFQNSAAWNIHPLMCEDLTVRNILVRNAWYAQNGDGIDVESCKNVLIENSVFDVGDDGLCIKSGRDEAGRKRGMPSENILIRNCTVYNAHGGFVIGSEMSGGARNIHVQHCTFIGTDIGLRFKTTRGRGGVVENIFIDNIVMKDIPGEAILFDMYYEAIDPIALAGEKREAPEVKKMPVTEGTPQFKNFYINNVSCDGAAKALFIRGLPEMSIDNIQINQFVARADRGIEISEATNIHLSDVKIISRETHPVIDILNSKNVSFTNLEVANKATLVFNIAGERTEKIIVKQSGLTDARQVAAFEKGASKKEFKLH